MTEWIRDHLSVTSAKKLVGWGGQMMTSAKERKNIQGFGIYLFLTVL